MNASTKKCPFCLSEIPLEAIRCRFCAQAVDTTDGTPVHAPIAPAFGRGRAHSSRQGQNRWNSGHRRWRVFHRDMVGIKFAAGSKLEAGSETPEQQAQFCSIIEFAKSRYDGLSQQLTTAREQKNGIAQQELKTVMTSVYLARNEDIFRLVERTSFGFENWLVAIKTISSPTATELNFSFHPLCSPITTIYATARPTSTYIDLLSMKKQGYHLTISDKFVANVKLAHAAPETSITPDNLEGSFTENGSITAPEYWAIIPPFETPIPRAVRPAKGPPTNVGQAADVTQETARAEPPISNSGFYQLGLSASEEGKHQRAIIFSRKRSKSTRQTSLPISNERLHMKGVVIARAR
jgi:hypothetical protein